jgi:hypothetical protein
LLMDESLTTVIYLKGFHNHWVNVF